MSKETSQALEDALAAHVADENGGALLTDYLVIAAAVPADGDMETHRYQIVVNDTLPLHGALGLIDYARTDAQRWQTHPEDGPS